MGVVFMVNGSQVTPLQSAAYLVVSGIVGFALAVLIMRARRKGG
jgi:glucose dehydrogenase